MRMRHFSLMPHYAALCRISCSISFFSRVLQIQLYEESGKFVESDGALVALQITSYGKSWIVRRSYEHFRLLDEQLHRCIYDRKFSQLPVLPEHSDKQQPREVSVHFLRFL